MRRRLVLTIIGVVLLVTGAARADAQPGELGGWRLDTVTYPFGPISRQGVATDGDNVVYRGQLTIPLDLFARGWDHIGDPDAHDGFVLDAFERKSGSKLFTLTGRDGARTEFEHPLAPGELANNSWVAITPDGQWFLSGEWGTMSRLLVFPMPRFNPAATVPLPLARTISLQRPVRNLQGCDFDGPTLLLCTTDDARKALLEIETNTGAVTVLGELPQNSLCTGTFEPEGVDVHDNLLLVALLEPTPCSLPTTQLLHYTRRP